MKFLACLYILCIFLGYIAFIVASSASLEVIYAVNCGGGAFVDSNGVHYFPDPLVNEGIASDYGIGIHIHRVPDMDQILYQTERYSTSNLIYDISIPEEGTYVLVTKYSEVFFDEPNSKVFDVRLNGHTVVIRDLDIFAKVGKATALEEYTQFDIMNNQLYLNDESFLFDGILSVEFLKGWLDNPKINAIVLFRGSINDIPKLQDSISIIHDDSEQILPNTFTRPSGRKSIDPYSSDESRYWPFIVIMALFLPILIFLCRL